MTYARPPIPSAAANRGAAARLAAARHTYTADAVQTVTPAQLVVMIYDGLLSHLDVAVGAIGRGDLSTANDRLTKSQALLFELEVGLDLSVWSGGAQLAQLYSFLATELVTANVSKDVERIGRCRALIAPLADAWRQAAASQAAAGSASAPESAFATVGA